LDGGGIEILKSLPREHGNGYLFGARAPLWDMAMLKLLRRMRSGVVVHGFRSSFRDWAGESTNFPHDICEAALAHTRQDKTHAAYQRGDLLLKRRKLMDAWAGFCAKSVTSGKVLTLGKARAS
jgi:integrase